MAAVNVPQKQWGSPWKRESERRTTSPWWQLASRQGCLVSGSPSESEDMVLPTSLSVIICQKGRHLTCKITRLLRRAGRDMNSWHEQNSTRFEMPYFVLEWKRGLSPIVTSHDFIKWNLTCQGQWGHSCRSVVSDSLCQPHGLQHTRLPCPSLSPRVCSNSCPLNPWCHPTVSSSIPASPPALNLSQHGAQRQL